MSLRNLIKITKVRKASSYEPKGLFKAEFLSPAISARLCFDSRLRHNAFRMPELRTFRLPYLLYLRHNGTGIQRSLCMQSAIVRMLLEQR